MTTSVRRISSSLSICAATLLGSALASSTASADSDKQGGIGMFHIGRGSVSAISAQVPNQDENMPMTTVTDVTAVEARFDFAALILPSVPGNMHGFESSLGMQLFPFDLDFSLGNAITFLTVGKGGVGSFRLGGSFGVGMSRFHTYGYLKARAAVVVIPEKLDVECVASWIPDGASIAWTDDTYYEQQGYRCSAYYNHGRTYEFFAQSLNRQSDGMDTDSTGKGEINGIGIGIGIAFDPGDD